MEVLGIVDTGEKKKDTRSIKNQNDFTKVKYQNMMGKLNLPFTLLETICMDSEEIDFF